MILLTPNKKLSLTKHSWQVSQVSLWIQAYLCIFSYLWKCTSGPPFWTPFPQCTTCKQTPCLSDATKMLQRCTFTHALLSIALIGKLLQYEHQYLSTLNPSVENVHFSSQPDLPICTQFIGSLRATLTASNGPVCRNKLTLLYLCSILLAQSYAPEQ